MKYRLLAVVLVTISSAVILTAQDCKPPAIVFNAKTENIFTPEQEMYLGDAMMERLEKDYRVFNDAEINAYVQAIGDRIAKHLPPSGIKFRFVVVDVPDTNAFAMAGGRIMVTRKLISFVRSEDELAGVIGHELGHAVVRHHAIDYSKYFKQVLGISSVGDRRDVFDKYNKFLESSRTKRVTFSGNHEDNQQLEADKIGVFAVFAAGYDPNATISFWKRLTEAKKTSFFSSFFGSTRPADKRLQEMINALKTIPNMCLDKLAGSTKTEFEKWKGFVINYAGLGVKESVSGLIYRRPLVPLRSDIEHLRFSPDGRYILAQDNATISVLRREPFSVVLRVDIEEAFPASFSADSKYLIVYNRNLRVQKWDVSEAKLVSTNDIAIRGGYWQTRISPDGNYIACYRYSGDLVIYDVATNDEIFKDKEFYLPTWSEIYWWQLMQSIFDIREYPALNMEFSPDGKYFLAGRKYSSQPGISSAGFIRQETITVDLTTRKTISVGDNVKKLLVASMDFIGPDKIIGQYGNDIKKSGIFTFPEGERLEQFELGGSSFTAGYSGNYVAVRPVSGAAVGLYDPAQKKFLLGNGKSALDVYGDVFVAERRDGEVGLFNAVTRENIASFSLPASPFGVLRASSLSADGNWLVVSDRSRGAAWDLRTGERKVHIRAFRGAYITPDSKVYSDFPKQAKVERSIAVMDLQNGTVNALGDMVSDANINQFGRYLVVRKSMKPKTEKPDSEKSEKEKKGLPYSEEEREKTVPETDVMVEVRDVRTGELLWKREFADERPGISVNPNHDTMVFGWSLKSAAANRIINADPSLKAKRLKMGDKDGDLLIELIDPQTGTVKGDFMIETGEGSFSPEFVTWAGDYLIVNDNRNRILVFSSKSGELLTRFFGSYAAISPVTKQIAIQNSPGRLAVYDVPTGREVTRMSFVRPISLMRFIDEGRHLFVLTSDQTAFMFDAAKFGETAAVE